MRKGPEGPFVVSVCVFFPVRHERDFLMRDEKTRGGIKSDSMITCSCPCSMLCGSRFFRREHSRLRDLAVVCEVENYHTVTFQKI